MYSRLSARWCSLSLFDGSSKNATHQRNIERAKPNRVPRTKHTSLHHKACSSRNAKRSQTRAQAIRSARTQHRRTAAPAESQHRRRATQNATDFAASADSSCSRVSWRRSGSNEALLASGAQRTDDFACAGRLQAIEDRQRVAVLECDADLHHGLSSNVPREPGVD